MLYTQKRINFQRKKSIKKLIFLLIFVLTRAILTEGGVIRVIFVVVIFKLGVK